MTTETVHTCKYCGQPTERYHAYGAKLAALFGCDGVSICDECSAKIYEFVEWENEQTCTELITCPWCGYEDQDSWELFDSDGDHECPECGKTFSYEREVSVTYTSCKRREDYDGELPEGY